MKLQEKEKQKEMRVWIEKNEEEHNNNNKKKLK